MSILSVSIEDRLHSAGYKTERIGGEVRVYDPVYSLIGSEVLVVGWDLKEIRSVVEAFDFIESHVAPAIPAGD